MVSDHAKQLEELNRLHDQGVLDDVAYQAARVRLAETVLAESVASESPPKSDRVHASPVLAADRRGIGVRLGAQSKARKATLGCLAFLGLCMLCGILGSIVESSQSKNELTSNALRGASSPSGTRTVSGMPKVASTPEPTDSVQELLTKVDQYWTAAEWNAIVSLLDDNSVALGDAALKEKLYAALINQGQLRADAANLTGAEFAFNKAMTLDSDRGIAQVKLAALEEQRNRDRVERVKDAMNYYTGDGDAMVAVSDVIAQGYFNTGYTTYRPNQPNEAQYLLIAVSVRNDSRREIHTNPNHFTLMHEGLTMNPETEMYSMSNYFDATDLQPDAYTSGWLLFLAPKAETYTLVYKGLWDDVVNKEIVVTERR